MKIGPLIHRVIGSGKGGGHSMRNTQSKIGKRRSAILLLATAHCLLPALLFGQAKTTVTGTLEGPDGSPASGFVSVTATNAFVSADGYNVVPGPPIHITIVNGAFSAALIPNSGSTTVTCSAPSVCSYYLATFNLSSSLGTMQFSQTWEVPASGPVAYQTIVVTSQTPQSLTYPFNQLTPASTWAPPCFTEWTASGWNCGPSGGSNVSVNGSPQANPNFNSSSPSPDSGYSAFTFKVLGDDVIAEGLLPASLANAPHKWLNSYNAVTGAFTQTQPASTDLADIATLNAHTATQLAAAPSQCGSGYAATGIAAGGNANCMADQALVVVASGSTALSTSPIAAGGSSVTTATAAGAAAGNFISANFHGSPVAVTGFIPGTSGTLAVTPYLTSGNINFLVYNNTSSPITPGSISIDWVVMKVGP